MPCVCCWKDFKDLGKHYPYCPYIRGDWTFWASPYLCTIVFYNQEAFTQHIKSFKPDNIHIESTPHNYVTPRTWTTHSREDAMKRQLMNTLYEHFRINPEFSDKWQVLNDGDMTPNLNNVADIGEVLNKCSELLRSARSGDKKESPIPQLKQIFLMQTEAVTEISTQPGLSRKRRRKFSVSYTALDSIKPINEVKVEFGENCFMEGFEFPLLPHFPQITQHEQDALANPNSNPHASNAVGDVDSWYPDLLAQPLQALPQMQNAHANANANITDAYGTFNNWDSYSQPQVLPTL
jgi:hypothetical protein